MKRQDIVAFARRDWAALAEAKSSYWAERKRSMAADQALAVGDSLRRQVREIKPCWPDAGERAEDLAIHLRVSGRRAALAARARTRSGPLHEPVEPEQGRSPTNVEEAVELFLRTGESDEFSRIWTGRTIVERAQHASDALLSALVAEVERRTAAFPPGAELTDLDLVAFTRRRVEPMVRGLFVRVEQEAVLSVLEGSVVLLTTANIRQVLLEARWLHTAWDLANLYLGSVSAPLLGPNAPAIVGLCEETTCYITPDYFRRQGPFEDFVVTPAAARRPGAASAGRLQPSGGFGALPRCAAASLIRPDWHS
jgi:hypothetical protein